MPVAADPSSIALLIGAGMLAGYANVVAGGGSLLTVPLLIFLGLPETVANATSRLALIPQNAAAVLRFARADRIDARLLRALLPPTLLGATLGAVGATRISDAAFRAILAWVMLGCAAVVVLEPWWTRRLGPRAPRLSGPRVWLSMLCVGVYGGLVQAGVGYLILSALVLVLGVPLLPANVMKVVLVLAYTPLALVVFLRHGLVEWVPGALLALGQALGGYLGASATLRRGERFVRLALAVVVLLSAVQLLFQGRGR